MRSHLTVLAADRYFHAERCLDMGDALGQRSGGNGYMVERELRGSSGGVRHGFTQVEIAGRGRYLALKPTPDQKWEI